MLRMQTHHCSCRALTTKQNDVKFCDHFEHPMLSGLRKFWQFSHFYGDYVSQPLEVRGTRSIRSQKVSS